MSYPLTRRQPYRVFTYSVSSYGVCLCLYCELARVTGASDAMERDVVYDSRQQLRHRALSRLLVATVLVSRGVFFSVFGCIEPVPMFSNICFR